MAKQNEVDAYNGIFHNRKERSPDTCYNIDESWKCYAKWKRPATKKPHILVCVLDEFLIGEMQIKTTIKYSTHLSKCLK